MSPKRVILGCAYGDFGNGQIFSAKGVGYSKADMGCRVVDADRLAESGVLKFVR